MCVSFVVASFFFFFFPRDEENHESLYDKNAPTMEEVTLTADWQRVVTYRGCNVWCNVRECTRRAIQMRVRRTSMGLVLRMWRCEPCWLEDANSTKRYTTHAMDSCQVERCNRDEHSYACLSVFSFLYFFSSLTRKKIYNQITNNKTTTTPKNINLLL